jgi:DNA polymerase-3 subunit epsilon/ATP-dependent DNA helicase DinG
LYKTYVAVDTETTGLKSDNDAIIEVAAVKFRGEQVLESWSSLVNPGRELPLKIERLTGITREQLKTAPRIEQVARHIARFVGEHPVVGHHIEFDVAFLRQQNLLLTNPTVDTDELARIVMPHASRFSLKQLAAELEIALPESHRALADAQTTMRLFNALCQRATQMDAGTLDEITRAADKSNWGLRDTFKEILRDAGRTSSSGSSIGEQLRAKGLIKNNRLTVLDDSLEDTPALRPEPQQVEIDCAALARHFDPGGALAEHFSGYERREQQIDMLRAVCGAFNDNGELLVEAGTGTGKSMAYLVPAIHFAVANSRHVVVSTNTINLQDQLIEKDIPDLRKTLDLDFRAMVLKGRSNYLCRHRFEQFQRKANKSAMDVRLLAKILAWLPTTTTGDRAELSMAYEEEYVWSEVCADETCNAQSCPYYQAGTCFFFRSRRRADSTHLIVVNHALLLSDMVVGNQVLPEYKHLIVDEAHHLEARATEALSVEVRQKAIEALLNEIGGSRAGLLGGFGTALRAGDITAGELEHVSTMVAAAHEAVETSQRTVFPFFDHLSQFLHAQHPPKGEFDQQVRLIAAVRARPDWATAQVLCEPLLGSLLRLSTALDRIARLCSELEILVGDDRLYQLGALRQRVDELRTNLGAIVNVPQPNGIYWATINAERGEVSLYSAPLRVSELLQKQIFSQKDCVVLTSATLRTAGPPASGAAQTFAYIRERLGLAAARELALDSPFDYEKSTLLYLPTDMPEPDSANYNKIVHDTLVGLCKATEGRTLILFTSRSQLRRTYEAINRPLELAGILVLAQYVDGSRRQLLDNFRSMPRSVLMGTRSFWEGVDVAGDALSCLVITRLPFAVPSDPIIAARGETFTDSFNEYMVPQAILSFRQGFGRLIRSASDRGVVVMLDRRVLTKAYGKAFIASLPKCSEKRGTCKDLPASAAEWLS